MKDNKYLVLVIDKRKAKIFMVHSNGAVERSEEFVDGQVPKMVQHGDDNWDAQDKIFRHIEDHLRRHLELVAQQASTYAEKEAIAGILIGTNAQLLPKIKKHLQHPLSGQVKGTFLVDMKAPFNEILERVKVVIAEIEKLG
jgi:peptide subunit release factor 1 (eRF1)